MERLMQLLAEHGFTGRQSAIVAPGKDIAWDTLIKLPEAGRTVGVVVKSSLYPGVIEQLLLRIGHGSKAGAAREKDPIPLVMTSRVSESSFEHCLKRGLNVLDLEGNIFLKLKGLCLERYRPMARNERPRVAGTAFTAKASRLVRVLLAQPEKKWRQKDLAAATQMSTGYVSQIVGKLAADGLISARGEVRLTEPDRLLDEWASRYRFDRHRKRSYAVNFAAYEEGLRKVADELERGGVHFAFTGWSGAFLRAPYGIPPAIMAYIDREPQPDSLSALFPVAREGNVWLYLPQDAGVLQVTQMAQALPVVTDAQLYVDLRTMPGRAREQAEVLREKCLQWKQP